MKSKMFLYCPIILLFSLVLNAQKLPSEPVITGYEHNSIKFFDSVSRSLECERSLINGSYEFFVVFKINNGKPGELEFVEISKQEAPLAVKTHIRNLIASTQGKWKLPQGYSEEEIVCQVLIVNEADNFEKRFDATLRIPKYMTTNSKIDVRFEAVVNKSKTIFIVISK